MITEGFVNLEIGKLLKEKGFDEFCFCINYPLPDGSPHSIIVPNLISNSMLPSVNEFRFCKYKEDLITIPTLQMVMRWLREVHKLYINIWADPKDVESNDFDIIFKAQVYNGTSNYGTYEFSTYEEAAEIEIKYCLENLI